MRHLIADFDAGQRSSSGKPHFWIVGVSRANVKLSASNPSRNRLLAHVAQKGSPEAAANLLVSMPTFCFFGGQPAYLLTRVAVPKSLLSRAPASIENMLFHAAQTCGEGTVRLSSKGESDRMTQRSAVQIRPPQP